MEISNMLLEGIGLIVLALLLAIPYEYGKKTGTKIYEKGSASFVKNDPFLKRIFSRFADFNIIATIAVCLLGYWMSGVEHLPGDEWMKWMKWMKYPAVVCLAGIVIGSNKSRSTWETLQ